MPENGRVEFVHRSWPADPAQLSVIRRELAGWLAPLALTDDETAGVVLAVDEAAANAVRHAYGPGRSGVVELTLWTEPGTLCVEVVDHGNWVPPVEPPAVDGLADRGRGIPLMSSMAEAVLIHHDSRGSRVLLRHPVPADRDTAAAEKWPTGTWSPPARRSRSASAPQRDPAQVARPHPVPVAPGVPTPSGSRSRGSGVGAHRPSTGA